jgi:SAM-dependent methyltransferase
MTAGAPRPITFHPRIYDKVVPFLPAAGSRVLDVGAGEGYFSRRMKELGMQVEACDFLTENFKCADIPILKANLNEAIPCESDTYDCVVSIEVVEHIENHFRFMSELMRVLKPGGVAIITTPNVLNLPARWHFYLYGFTDCAPVPLDPHRAEYFMQHISPISLPELLFHIERGGGRLEALTTDRVRRSAWIPMLFYPLFAYALRRKLHKRRYAGARALHDRHLHWILHRANLMGRVTIAVARKLPPA